MHIDWTQTLVGSDGTAGRPLHAAEVGAPQLASLVQASKVAGILFAATLFGIAIALSPIRGKERALADAILLSGLLVSHVIGFGLLLRLGASGLIASALAGALMPLFAMALGAPPFASIALVLIVAADTVLAVAARATLERSTLVRTLVAVLGVGATGLALDLPDPGAGAMLLGALAPHATVLALLTRKAKSPASNGPAAAEVNAALLVAAMQRLSGIQVVCDTIGNLERPDAGAPFALHMQADTGLGASLVERVMISDRPQLLQSLSNAAHSGITAQAFVLRLDLREPEQDNLRLPRFAPYQCSVAPAAGLKGRAVVTLISADQAVPLPMLAPGENAAPSCGMDDAALSRAFHDAVSPFNAGLGYLEIIADPDLSPDDIVAFRSYAIDARKAVSEAHRNTLLMGRWLRLLTDNNRELRYITPAALIEDAIRGFNLAERDDMPEIIVNASGSAVEIMLDVDACRFAVQVLLRGALAQEDIPDRIELDAVNSDAGLCIGLRIFGQVELPKMADAFQLQIEQVASTFSKLDFHTVGPMRRSLTIHRTQAASAPTPEAPQSPMSAVHARLAS